MNNIARLAEQQKNQSVGKTKNRVLTQRHDVQSAGMFKPVTDNVTQLMEKSNSEYENTQTPSIQNVTATQSSRDT